ncbi:hypothetical protein LWI28_022293 [Acer negundo]|uniref:Uncharacterized protein n=1 Tax=Acer negundo TaxID=4023 RepID=A0AAD5NK62_ACENE|nr:hypothetical protein LWI28_022293 [Acer negundo]
MIVFVATSSVGLPATLPTALLVSFPPFSASSTANVGILLRPTRPTTTPHLTLDKSQPSPPTTLIVLPVTHSPFSEMTPRATRVRATSSMALPAAFTVSPPPSSPSPTANVGISLEPSWPITTPPLTPDKS